MRRSGKAYGSPAISTTTARCTDSVTGSCRWKLGPLPGSQPRRTVPPISCTTLRPTSMPALGGRLDAVVDGVAQHVVDGRLDALEDVAVDVDVLARDDEIDRLAQRAREIADEPGEAAHAVGERAHAAGDGLAVEAAGQILG